MQDGVAQHLDLAAPAVAGVDADAVVTLTEQGSTVPGRSTRLPDRGAVGADVVLNQLEQRPGPIRRYRVRVVAVLLRVPQHELHLPRVTSPRSKEGIPRCTRGRVVAAKDIA